MFIIDLFESAQKRLVVTYPGRFQPFHQGHADVFRSLAAKFGGDNVFIVTGNKTDNEKSPFNFSDKVQFMHAAGIPDHNIIEASQVYKLPDQFASQADSVIFITAVGSPDAQRLNPGSVKKDGSPSYYQTLPEDLNEAATADMHGYVIIADERAKQISIGGQTVDASHGTAVRNLWNQVRNNPKQRAEFIEQLYGKADPALGKILDKIPTGAPEPVAAASPKLKKPGTGKSTEMKPVKVNAVAEGEVVAFPKKHKGDISDMHTCPKCGGDTQGGTYMGHKVQVCMPCKQVYLPPNSGIDQKGNKIKEDAAATGVVKDGNDPRYVMATMGDQNDVTSDTLNQMMKGYDLIGKKSVGKQKPVKGNVGKGVKESMYQYDKLDPYNSEFAPDVGMGRMTLRGWKQSLTRRVKEMAKELEAAGQNVDRAMLWDHVYKKLKSLNLDPIAQEIELGQHELESIRQKGGQRSRAFNQNKYTNESASAGGTGAGAVATSTGDGSGFGWSIFYKRQQPQVKKAKKK